VLDRLGHRHLFTTVLVARAKCSGERPVGGEEFMQIHDVS